MFLVGEMQRCVKQDVKYMRNKWKCGVAEMAIESFLLRKFCPISGPPDIAAFFWAHHSHRQSLSRRLYDSDSASLIPIYLVFS